MKQKENAAQRETARQEGRVETKKRGQRFDVSNSHRSTQRESRQLASHKSRGGLRHISVILDEWLARFEVRDEK